MASSIQTPSASQIVISPPEISRPSGSVTGRESGVPHRDAVLADVARSDVASDDAALGDLQSTIAPVQADSPEPVRKKRTVLYASVGVAAAAVAIAGLLMLRPRAGAGSDPVSTKMSAVQRTTGAVTPVVKAPATMTGSTAAGAAAIVVATRAESLPSANATPAATAPVVKPEQHAPESAPLRLPRIDVHLAPVTLPTIPDPSVPAAQRVDSIARSATERQRASDIDRTGAGEKVSPATSADVENAVTPAKLIGRVPSPRFPDVLLRSGHREGQVLVRFMVTEFGSVDVASMIVERSDHELFTSAVRDILPGFRFEPARTHAPESKPVASWVSVPFRFTTK
jgi:protein TonB